MSKHNPFNTGKAACVLLAAGLFLLLVELSGGQDKDRRLGTCGPPQRKNPERQTSAEGMPPLPLPVTPMRRSEPKAEPAPPLFLAKLEYGVLQDWNTDPGDVDNLLRHCRSQLGLWYGWRHSAPPRAGRPAQGRQAVQDSGVVHVGTRGLPV